MGEYSSTVVSLFPQAESCKGGDMERLNPFSFYDFGKRLQSLLALPDGHIPTNKAFWPVWQAKFAMENLLKGDPIPIGVSAHKAAAVRDSLEHLMNTRFTRKAENGESGLRFPEEGDPPIEAWLVSHLKQAIEQFESVFADEMRETAAYFVPRRGIYYTPSLVDSADETFPKALLPFIPEKAREDWRAAGRCLAFNLLSASGFHVARAVEACLESYYQLFSGKPGETLRSWYDYHKALKEIAEKNTDPSPSDKTLVELDQMREDYRNPIVHPRVVLSEGDSRMLFANGESLIIAMAQEIAEATKGVQTGLALVGGTSAEAAGQ